MTGRALLTALLTAAGLSLQPLQPAGQEAIQRWEVREAQISPDGRNIVFTRGPVQKENPRRPPINLWRIPFAGGTMQRLTESDADESHVRWSPRGDRIAFLSRHSSTGAARLYVMGAEGGNIRSVTGPLTSLKSFAWHADGRRIAYFAEAGDRGVWVVDITSGRRSVVPAILDGAVLSVSWSPSMDSVAVVKQVGTGPPQIVIAPTSGRGAAQVLVNAVGGVRHVGWAPDGQSLAWLASAGPGSAVLSRILTVAKAGGTPSEVPKWSDGIPERMSWTPDGRLSVVLGNGRETWVDVCGLRPLRCANVIPSGIAFIVTSPSWSWDTMRYAVVGSSESHPQEVFVGSLPSPQSGALAELRPPPVRRLTFVNP